MFSGQQVSILNRFEEWSLIHKLADKLLNSQNLGYMLYQYRKFESTHINIYYNITITILILILKSLSLLNILKGM